MRNALVKSLAGLVVPASVIVGGAVAAAPTCLVEIDGRRAIDGPCRLQTAPSGRTLIEGRSGQKVSIGREFGRESRAAWNGRYGDRVESLDTMRRTGPSCWENHRGRICAWGR